MSQAENLNDFTPARIIFFLSRIIKAMLSIRSAQAEEASKQKNKAISEDLFELAAENGVSQITTTLY